MADDSMKEEQRLRIEEQEWEGEERPGEEVAERVPERQGDWEKVGDQWVRRDGGVGAG